MSATRPLLRLGVALGLLFLAGSASAAQIDFVEIDDNYTFMEFLGAAGGREAATVIHGNPFPIDQAAFDAAVTAVMSRSGLGRATTFTTTPGPSASRHYRTVLTFGGTTGAPRDLCRREPSPPAQAAGVGRGETRVRLAAVFCRGGRVLSHLAARANVPASGPASPAFEALIREVVLELLPPIEGSGA